MPKTWSKNKLSTPKWIELLHGLPIYDYYVTSLSAEPENIYKVHACKGTKISDHK